MSNVADNQFIRQPAPLPVVKMKQVKLQFKEDGYGITYKNMDGRLVCHIKTPPPQFWQHADCTLYPDAKLDELANVIANLWGMIVAKHNGVL